MKKIILLSLSILLSSLFVQAQQIEKNSKSIEKAVRYTTGYVSFSNSTSEVLNFELVNVYGGTGKIYRIDPGRSVSGIAINSGVYDVHVHPNSGKEYNYRIEDGYGVIEEGRRWGLCYTFEQGDDYNTFYFSVNK